MGIERDYLMRQLMMLLEVVQKIINFRRKGLLQEAEEQIDYFYSCLELEKITIEMPVETLINYLTVEKKLTNHHLEAIAIVLKEQGELSQENRIKQDYFRKAYFILEKVDRESTSFSMERQMKIAELRTYLN